MNAIILSAGKGCKLWPYSSYHNKGMMKIGNTPICKHTVDSLLEIGVNDITIVAQSNVSEIKNFFRKYDTINVVCLSQSLGSADSLYQVKEKIEDDSIVLYGDCFITKEDLHHFVQEQNDVLVSALQQDSTLQICAEISENHELNRFWGHPRGDFHYFGAGFKLHKEIIPYLETTADIFNETKVGVGSPKEQYLENAINDYMDDGHQLTCCISQHLIYDIDKPWQILEANHYYNETFAATVKNGSIGEQTFISDQAKVHESVVIGNHCYIGDHVVIEKGCIIEDHTRIDHGAIIGCCVHIGMQCTIENYCKIGDYSSIGNCCIIGHTSEIIEAVLFDKVYLYHYGEFYGVIGTHTDLGAGTTCGTLRFDDQKTQHHVVGHKEHPAHYSNACFIGDYSRTGVGAILLPGCKIGSKSVVGSGVILNDDVEDNTLIYPKQELCKVPWGDDKYGW